MNPFFRVAPILNLCLVIVLSACTQSRPTSGESQSEYVRVIQPIFDAKCTTCHSGGQSATGLQLDSWDHIMAGSSFGEAVIAFDADNSLLIELATKYTGGSHPSELDGPMLAELEIQQLKDWIDRGAQGPQSQIPFADSRNLIYVTNQGEATVNVIDSESNTVARRVDMTTLGFESTAKPHHIAVEDDGSFWYVSLISGNTVLKFSRANELVGRAEFLVPGLLALDSNSDRLYVGRSMAAVNPPTRIGFIDRSTMDIEEIEVFHPRPHAIAVDPSGQFVISGSLGENRMLAVDVTSGDGSPQSVDGPIHTLVQFAISPDGSTLIVGGQLTGKLFFYDVTRLPEMRLVKTIDVNMAPWHPIFSPDGSAAYLANKMANTVTVIDMERKEVSTVISGKSLSQPHGAALSHDGRYLYISGNNLDGTYEPRYDLGDNALVGTVSIIDTSTLEIVKVLEVGGYPSGAGSSRAR